MEINWIYLKERCQYAITEANRRGDTDTALFFELLYNTGFRGAECVSLENWTLTQDNQVFVPPHKRGNAKLINAILLPTVIYESMVNDQPWIFEGSLSTYKRLFVSYSGLRETHVGQKKLLLHTFRHVFIKRKADQGESLALISQQLGIRRTLTTAAYVMKQYQTEPFTQNL